MKRLWPIIGVALMVVGLMITLSGCGVPQTIAAAPTTALDVGVLPPPSPTTVPIRIEVEMPVSTTLEPAVRVSPPTATFEVMETGWGSTPGDCDQYIPLLEKYGIDVAWGLRIMNRESLCLYNVHNGKLTDDSYGLFQINTYGNNWSGYKGVQELCGVTAKDQLYDPETNIRCAAAMLNYYGKKPWQT